MLFFDELEAPYYIDERGNPRDGRAYLRTHASANKFLEPEYVIIQGEKRFMDREWFFSSRTGISLEALKILKLGGFMECHNDNGIIVPYQDKFKSMFVGNKDYWLLGAKGGKVFAELMKEQEATIKELDLPHSAIKYVDEEFVTHKVVATKENLSEMLNIDIKLASELVKSLKAPMGRTTFDTVCLKVKQVIGDVENFTISQALLKNDRLTSEMKMAVALRFNIAGTDIPEKNRRLKYSQINDVYMKVAASMFQLDYKKIMAMPFDIESIIEAELKCRKHYLIPGVIRGLAGVDAIDALNLAINGKRFNDSKMTRLIEMGVLNVRLNDDFSTKRRVSGYKNARIKTKS